MTNKKLKQYNSSIINMFGLNTEFFMCHIPFLVEKDVLGCLALEGTSGSGKTTIVKRIGKLNELATGGKVKVFSADKARYEDFVGIPIPNESTGHMQIYPMPNSVAEMETVVIDEANRANYENQEKWMSLIATREIDGMPTKCKYLYLAMNPVLGDDNDNYEGVMPLDKAMGERVFALVKMNSFSQLSREVRFEIMKASFNQTEWEPTDEDVESHVNFLTTAKELYHEYKETLLEKVVDYVDTIQQELKKESRNSIIVEARRAQFIVTNILAVHALDSSNSKTPIELSALAALSASFPNRLWEQVVNLEAIKMAHERHKSLLKLSAEERKRAISNIRGLEKPLAEIEKVAAEKPSKEQLSKVIHQNLPDVNEDPVNHYVFSCSIVSEFSDDATLESKKQAIMKEQEFTRLYNIASKVRDNDLFKECKALLKSNTKNLPKTLFSKIAKLFPNAEDIETDSDREAIENLISIMPIFSGMGLAIIQITKVTPKDLGELLLLIHKIVDTTHCFKNVKEKYL